MLNVTELTGFGVGGDLKNQLTGLTEYTSPNFVSGCSGGYICTPVLNLADWISPELLYPGKTFTVTVHHRPCTGWYMVGGILTSTFVYGTSLTTQTSYVGRKQWYMQIVYTANNSIKGCGFYSGDSTNSPYGGLYISDVTFPI